MLVDGGRYTAAVVGVKLQVLPRLVSFTHVDPRSLHSCRESNQLQILKATESCDTLPGRCQRLLPYALGHSACACVLKRKASDGLRIEGTEVGGADIYVNGAHTFCRFSTELAT